MRKLLTAAVATALMGLSVSSSLAANSPFQAVKDAAPLLGGTPVASGLNTDWTNTTGGAELAGLVHAYQLGVISDSVVTTAATNIVTGEAGDYYGDEAYALAKLSTTTSGYAATAGSSVLNYYNVVVPGANASYTAHANSLFNTPAYTLGNPANSDTALVLLSNHVLATNVLGLSTANSQYASALASHLASYTNADSSGSFSNTTILAMGLWALKSSGYANAFTVSGTVFNGTLASLASSLDSTLMTEYGSGNLISEDAAYGILALQAFGATYLTDINTLQYALALAVDFGTGPTGLANPGDVAFASGGSVNPATVLINSRFAGAALQALPEPASLSLLGLAGMGLLARRRRA